MREILRLKKDLFLAVFRRKEKEFSVMIIRGSIETLPIEVLEEVMNDHIALNKL